MTFYNSELDIFGSEDTSSLANHFRRRARGLVRMKINTSEKTQMSTLMAQEGMRVPGEAPPQEAANGPASGVIGGENATPAETVADDIPMDVPEGSFIINAAAAEVAGYGDIKTMIMDAIGVARRLGVEISTGDEKVGDEEAVDLLVSKGEVYIEPTLAKIIGYDVLEKINNRGKREVARRQKEAEAKQQQEPQQAPQPQMAQDGGFVKKRLANGGETRQEFPDYIKKYFMPEIDYHLETIRTKTVARNQYGQPTTAYTSGVRRGDKIYEIPTYDRKGGILSRAEVEASLDNYIEKYGDFGIPQSEYNTLMGEKEAWKQELYSKDNRFKVPEDAITQKIVLPEEEQQDSGGFVPKK